MGILKVAHHRKAQLWSWLFQKFEIHERTYGLDSINFTEGDVNLDIIACNSSIECPVSMREGDMVGTERSLRRIEIYNLSICHYGQFQM